MLLKASFQELDKALNYSMDVRIKNFGRKIYFYIPTFLTYKTNFISFPPETYPSFSITGESCMLHCLHCNGRLLKGMIPVRSPEELIYFCEKFKRKGAVGCLISGGCTLAGNVPLEAFLDAIHYIKRKLKFRVSIHTGFIRDKFVAQRLSEAGVDSILIDVVGSDDTLREIYRLNFGVKGVEESLKILHEARIPIVPHVLVGLHYGQIVGEFKALKLISKYDPKAVVIIVLTPLRGTPMEKITPPNPQDIAKIIVYARLLLQSVPIVLGCARPVGKHRTETDKLAVKAGINAIVLPSNEAVYMAEIIGLESIFKPTCCSHIYQDIHKLNYGKH